MSIFPNTNDSRHSQHMAIKHWSLIPEIVIVLAFAWVCFDLALRLDGYQESHWMVDLDILAVIALIVGAVLLALMHQIQSAESKTIQHSRREISNPQPPQFHVSDGGMGLSATNSRPNKQATKKPAPSFDGGTFPIRKRR